MPLLSAPSQNSGRTTRQNRNQCGAWTETNFSNMIYVPWKKQYNDPQHRTKPDPLTDTALPKQYRQVIKPSYSDWQYWQNYTDYTCSPTKSSQRWVRSQGIFEHTPSMSAVVVDWESKVLEDLMEQFVNIGSSLAEYRATASTFYNYAQSVGNAWKRWKGLKKGRVKLTPCSIPAAELAYSFGIAPLTEDLFSSVEALKLRLEAPIYRDFFTTATARAVTNPTNGSYTQITRKTVISNRVEGRIELKPFYSGVFGLGNPTTWAWELIPFSFVVDWAIPIGDWLAHVDILRRIQSVKGTRTIKEKYTCNWKTYNSYYNPPIVGNTWGKLHYQSHERKLLSSIPVPPLPRWKPSLSWHKVYRAITLLVAVNQPCRKHSGRR